MNNCMLCVTLMCVLVLVGWQAEGASGDETLKKGPSDMEWKIRRRREKPSQAVGLTLPSISNTHIPTRTSPKPTAHKATKTFTPNPNIHLLAMSPLTAVAVTLRLASNTYIRTSPRPTYQVAATTLVSDPNINITTSPVSTYYPADTTASTAPPPFSTSWQTEGLTVPLPSNNNIPSKTSTAATYYPADTPASNSDILKMTSPVPNDELIEALTLLENVTYNTNKDNGTLQRYDYDSTKNSTDSGDGKRTSLPSTNSPVSSDAKRTSLLTTNSTVSSEGKRTSLPTTNSTVSSDTKRTSWPTTNSTVSSEGKRTSLPTTNSTVSSDTKRTSWPTTNSTVSSDTKRTSWPTTNSTVSSEGKGTSLPTTNSTVSSDTTRTSLPTPSYVFKEPNIGEIDNLPVNSSAVVHVHNYFRRKVKAANMDRMYYSEGFEKELRTIDFCQMYYYEERNLDDGCISVWDISNSNPAADIESLLNGNFGCATYDWQRKDVVCTSNDKCVNCDLSRYRKAVWHDAKEVGCVFQRCSGYNNTFACQYRNCPDDKGIYIPSNQTTKVCSMCPPESSCDDGLCNWHFSSTESPTTSLPGTTFHITTPNNTNMTTPVPAGSSTSTLLGTTTSSSWITNELERLDNITINKTNAFAVTNDTLRVIDKDTSLEPGQVSLVADILEKVANLPEIPKDVFHPFMHIIDDLLYNPKSLQTAEKEKNSSQILVKSIDKLVDHLELPPSKHGAANVVNYTGIYLDIVANSADCTKGNVFVNGLVADKNGTVEWLYSSSPMNRSNFESTETWIQLPEVSFCPDSSSIAKILVIVYKRDALFPANKTIGDSCNTKVSPNSKVATAHITKHTANAGYLISDVVMGFKVHNEKIDRSLQQTYCGYYDVDENNWKSDGCYEDKSSDPTDGYVLCKCNHLTDFAMLITTQDSNALVCNPVLSILGTIASVVSCVSMVILLVVTIVPFVQQSTSSPAAIVNKATYQGNETFQLISFYSTLLIFFLFFAIFADPKITNLSTSGCAGMAAVMYWLLIAIFLFALFRGIHFYRLWIELFRRERSVWNIPYFGKTTTAVALVLPFIVAFAVFGGKRRVYERDDHFCWIRFEYVTYMVILPASLFLVLNIILSIVISQRILFGLNPGAMKDMKRLIAKRNADRLRLMQLVLFVISLQIILQIPWVLQYFSYVSPNANGFHYVFTIFNGFQGLWLLLHHFYMKFLKKQQIKARTTSVVSTMTTSAEDSNGWRTGKAKQSTRSGRSNNSDIIQSGQRSKSQNRKKSNSSYNNTTRRFPNVFATGNEGDCYDRSPTVRREDFDALYNGYKVPRIAKRHAAKKPNKQHKGGSQFDSNEYCDDDDNVEIGSRNHGNLGTFGQGALERF